PPRDLAEEVAALEPQVVVVDPRHGPRILADRLRVEAKALDGAVAPARHRERPAVRLDEHGAVAIRAIDARADGGQSGERGGVASSQRSVTAKSRWSAAMPPAWSMSAWVVSVACSASTPRFQRNGATARSPASRRHGPPAPASTTIARPSGVSTTIASP